MEKIESIIFITNDAMVYQVPPLKSISYGHSAGDWDVENPMWKGRLKVVEIEDNGLTCELRLEDLETGELFAAAPYYNDGKGVEPVRDSSRFFAIRVVNGDKQATLGLGFNDRNIAFEFNIALQDFQKHSQPVESTNSNKDFSLKEGQSIHINIGKSQTTTSSSTVSNDYTSEAKEPIPTLLPPPPPSANKQERDDPFDDDFGDFVG